MKRTELRRLIAEYKKIKAKLQRSENSKLKEKMGEIEHRYNHETGRGVGFTRDYIK